MRFSVRFYYQLRFTKVLRSFRLTFAAVCHIELQPSLQTVGTRKTTRLHDADAESGASQRLWTLCPNAVFVADQLAENAAQKHQEKPCQPHDALNQLRSTTNDAECQEEEQCEYLHTLNLFVISFPQS